MCSASEKKVIDASNALSMALCISSFGVIIVSWICCFNPLLSIIYAPVEAFYVAKYIEPRISRIIPQIHIAAGQTIYNVFIWLILVVWPVAFIHTHIYLRVLFPNLLISLDRR